MSRRENSWHLPRISCTLTDERDRVYSLSTTKEPIKTKIGVYSGKGGVGKTSVTINLAMSLNNLGYKTGIFDVDIVFEPPWNPEMISEEGKKELGID